MRCSYEFWRPVKEFWITQIYLKKLSTSYPQWVIHKLSTGIDIYSFIAYNLNSYAQVIHRLYNSYPQGHFDTVGGVSMYSNKTIRQNVSKWFVSRGYHRKVTPELPPLHHKETALHLSHVCTLHQLHFTSLYIFIYTPYI